jgi:uncharacterized repeat protein (TIGR03803 family)
VRTDWIEFSPERLIRDPCSIDLAIKSVKFLGMISFKKSPVYPVLILTLIWIAMVGVASAAPVLTTLVSFQGGISQPSGLVQAGDGNLYGTTQVGGDTDNGVLFKLNPITQSLSALVMFDGTNNGAVPVGLSLGIDGAFYGVTSSGGGGDGSGNGTVYRADTNGGLRVLATLSGNDGSAPNPGLVQGLDGKFYGTTEGDKSLPGSIIRVSATGNLTTLTHFNGTNGFAPKTGLLLARDGNWYGTTSAGGSKNVGTLFRMDGKGNLTTLVSFDGTNGANPQGDLIQGKDGGIYGTTYQGGDEGLGTIFRLDGSGSLTTLGSFNNTNGSAPLTGLVRGKDGYLYGTTSVGGESNYGTIFRVGTNGGIVTIVSFDGDNGAYPNLLITGNDGLLYGTTQNGGDLGTGTVFQLTGYLVQPASLIITRTNQIYDGMTKSVAVSTLPAGLSTVVTYNGTTSPPVQAGTYNVIASIKDSVYSGNATSQLTVDRAPQTISGFLPFSARTFGGAGTITLVASSGSGLPITWSSSNTNVALIRGSSVVILGAGTSTITATQPGNSNWAPAVTRSNVLTVARGSQTITLRPIPTVSYSPGGIVQFQASAPGGGVTLTSGNSNVLSISSGVGRIHGAGTVTISASQNGGVNYLPAKNVSASLVISKAAQSITFPLTATNRFVKGGKIRLNAISTSGLPVTFSGADPKILLITVTKGETNAVMVAAGNTKVTAIQPGDANYNPAAPVVRSILLK